MGKRQKIDGFWVQSWMIGDSVYVQGVPENIAQSLSTTILQPYIRELSRFQQNVQKENVNTIKASVWIRPLNILCYSTGKWTIWKQSSRLGAT